LNEYFKRIYHEYIRMKGWIFNIKITWILKKQYKYINQEFLIFLCSKQFYWINFDKFYKSEKDSLINYLSNNGDLYYMTAIYRLFYRRE
jgi:hypothetical protein